jgi:hypothetical protein
MADNEYFMVTAVDDMGNDLVAYVASKDKHQYVQMMSSEYGNIKVEPVSLEDIPKDVVEQMQNNK